MEKKKIAPQTVANELKQIFANRKPESHWKSAKQIKSFWSRNKKKIQNELQLELLQENMMTLINDVNNPQGKTVGIKREQFTSNSPRKKKKKKMDHKKEIHFTSP